MNFETERDWPECKEDLSGVYYHYECHMCGKEFNGYKSRMICFECNKESELYDD